LEERTGPGWRQQVCSERPQTAERSGFYRGPSPSDSLSPLRGEREQKFDRFVNFVTTKWNWQAGWPWRGKVDKFLPAK